jgi:hypothetical protein
MKINKLLKDLKFWNHDDGRWVFYSHFVLKRNTVLNDNRYSVFFWRCMMTLLPMVLREYTHKQSVDSKPEVTSSQIVRDFRRKYDIE